MNTPHLVEALLRGLVHEDEACDAYPELGELCDRAEGGGAPVPLQWALCVTDLPRARGLLIHAALALLDLVECLDEARLLGTHDGCALWHGLATAPDWLLRPAEPDDAVPDIALLLERDETYGGDWQPLIEALHRAGSRRWQWAIVRCRAMQRYEQTHHVDLCALLDPTACDPCPSPDPTGDRHA